jgi:hypothetical protein
MRSRRPPGVAEPRSGAAARAGLQSCRAITSANRWCLIRSRRCCRATSRNRLERNHSIEDVFLDPDAADRQSRIVVDLPVQPFFTDAAAGRCVIPEGRTAVVVIGTLPPCRRGLLRSAPAMAAQRGTPFAASADADFNAI